MKEQVFAFRVVSLFHKWDVCEVLRAFTDLGDAFDTVLFSIKEAVCGASHW